MPIYEYKCQKCSAVFEALVRGREKPACPECGSGRLKKLVSSFGVGRAAKNSRPACGGERRGNSCCGGCSCGHCGG